MAFILKLKYKLLIFITKSGNNEVCTIFMKYPYITIALSLLCTSVNI